MTDFELTYDEDAVTLRLAPQRRGLLDRLRGGRAGRDLNQLDSSDQALLLAIADTKTLAEDMPGSLTIGSDSISLSHRLASELDAATAATLGLPPLVDLTLATDAEGLLGSPGFRLRYNWSRNGIRQNPQRVGAILKTGSGPRRLPGWMLEAIEVADGFNPGAGDAEHWTALARFRRVLEPGVQLSGQGANARIAMTDFMSGLRVRLADRFSINSNEDGSDFDVVPFSRRSIEAAGHDLGQGGVPEAAAELDDQDLRTFQRRVRERGALASYRLAPGSFLVVDRAAAPALKAMSEAQQASASERRDFIRNPKPRIAAAVENDLRQYRQLDSLNSEAQEEAIEFAAESLFVETKEFSDRVTGLRRFEKSLDMPEGSGTTWLPEILAQQLAEKLAATPTPDLEALRSRVDAELRTNAETVNVAGVELPARSSVMDLIDAHLVQRAAAETDEDDRSYDPGGPVILDTIINFKQLLWQSQLRPRQPAVSDDLPDSVRTSLKTHQTESFRWQVEAWRAGLPGLLNADEQGLGKTLQTISFLAWLRKHAASAREGDRGPVLVVAPTSLLETWEGEVRRHMAEPGLGHLVRLYGSGIGSRRRSGSSGRDIDGGEGKLDLEFLREAAEEGRGHRFWILTTYTTLTNYQHSLARIPFSAAVFDEIQNLKNPDSLRAHAARALNAEFRIGLTGTPIENSAVDLWAIMDQLAPGSLDTLDAFRDRYARPDAANMAELHGRVFRASSGKPPLALRREKDQVAKDLPQKTRLLHPRLMPKLQAEIYEDARLKLAQGGLGAALKMLHHIRSVSVHPTVDSAASDGDVIAASGRLQATFDVLRKIAPQGEKALVFIEHRRMQHRFIELARAEFGLNRIDLINGDTPIPQRQAIVNRFQEGQDLHVFDLLVLGPKAAGTGLTLTAATHVIHLSRWWNPAVEEQCNDRVHRIGQTRAVTVHVPMAVHPGFRENSFDCLLHTLMQRKRRLASSALWPMGDTSADAAELQKQLSDGVGSSDADPLRSAISAMFAREGIGVPPLAKDGSLPFS